MFRDISWFQMYLSSAQTSLLSSRFTHPSPLGGLMGILHLMYLNYTFPPSIKPAPSHPTSSCALRLSKWYLGIFYDLTQHKTCDYYNFIL